MTRSHRLLVMVVFGGLLVAVAASAGTGPTDRSARLGDEALQHAVVVPSIVLVKERDGDRVPAPVAATALAVVLAGFASAAVGGGVASVADRCRRWRARLEGAPPAPRRAS